MVLYSMDPGTVPRSPASNCISWIFTGLLLLLLRICKAPKKLDVRQPNEWGGAVSSPGNLRRLRFGDSQRWEPRSAAPVCSETCARPVIGRGRRDLSLKASARPR
ncbi:hypothetical protein GQ53DRAFT_420476 [Thozetella sp. PMI_491]|nr:hypothetical protein GQ53DRAFT_420476 [Thozetella sp. PMI_491]